MVLWLKNIAGWIFAHWRLVVYTLLIAVVLIMATLLIRSCGKKTPKLDQAEIQKAQQAIADHDRETMQKILTNSDVKEQQIDANLAEGRNTAVNAIAESKKKWANANTDEMAAELERRARESQ